MLASFPSLLLNLGLVVSKSDDGSWFGYGLCILFNWPLFPLICNFTMNISSRFVRPARTNSTGIMSGWRLGRIRNNGRRMIQFQSGVRILCSNWSASWPWSVQSLRISRRTTLVPEVVKNLIFKYIISDKAKILTTIYRLHHLAHSYRDSIHE